MTTELHTIPDSEDGDFPGFHFQVGGAIIAMFKESPKRLTVIEYVGNINHPISCTYLPNTVEGRKTAGNIYMELVMLAVGDTISHSNFD